MSALPLSRPVAVSSIPAEGLTVEVVAGEAERAALAAENAVESVERLVARFDLKPAGREGLAATGKLEAETTRICVVTLEPFVERVAEDIDIRFEPEERLAARAEDDDPPDAIVGGVVDLGSVAAEFFALGLDPYPRKPGATFDQPEDGDGDEASPFAALRKLSPNRGKD